MTTVVYKYRFPWGEAEFGLELPEYAILLHVDIDPETRSSYSWGEAVAVWAEVDPDASVEMRHFMVRGTGHPFPDDQRDDQRQFIGTVISSQGYVFHIYETDEKGFTQPWETTSP